MGGNAFRETHPEASFPRMQPSVYQALKARLHAALSTLYREVSTPHEAPQKRDHGDIDFVVYSPKWNFTHDKVKAVLGACYSIPAKGTSFFALPWDTAVGPNPTGTEGSDAFVQVDILECSSLNEYDRVFFCHSYGDLMMILGMIAHSVGLSTGTSGLRFTRPLPTSPRVLFSLSVSYPEILQFFGLSFVRWREGFSTQREIFEWIVSSRFYVPGYVLMAEDGYNRGRNARQGRTMYQDFLSYARLRNMGSGSIEPLNKEAVMEEALEFFGRQELYHRILLCASVKEHAKQTFSGKIVTEWTGVNGPPVHWIMKEVKRRLGGEVLENPFSPQQERIFASGTSFDTTHWTLSAWEIGVKKVDVEGLRALVSQVKEEMGNAGRLEFDWKRAREAKVRRREAQRAAVGWPSEIQA